MTNILRKTLVASGFVGVLTMAAPSLAQTVMIGPSYGGPYGAYAGPYVGYAYAPGYRGYRDWDYPAGYDTGGMAFSYRDLGWQLGPPGAAPTNPCYLSQRQQNRC